MAEFASNGKGNLGVTLGAVGTGLGLMANGGLLGNSLFNGYGYNRMGGYNGYGWGGRAGFDAPYGGYGWNGNWGYGGYGRSWGREGYDYDGYYDYDRPRHHGRGPRSVNTYVEDDDISYTRNTINNISLPESDHFITRYDAHQMKTISDLETKNSLLESEIYTDKKILETYENLATRLNNMKDKIQENYTNQAVYNATNSTMLGCLQGQVHQLQSMTKMYIPSENVSPTPMPQFNSWTAPTV